MKTQFGPYRPLGFSGPLQIDFDFGSVVLAFGITYSSLWIWEGPRVEVYGAIIFFRFVITIPLPRFLYRP